MAPTQGCRHVGDAFPIRNVVETKDAVHFGERGTVYVGRPFNPALATEIDFVQWQFDELDAIRSIFDNDLAGGA